MEQPWSLAKRLGFRFIFLFWLLQFGLPSPLNRLPGVSEATDSAWRWLSLRLGHALGLEVPIHDPSGSGDTLLDWLMLASFGGVALALTALWSLIQRKPTDHAKLADFLQLYLRIGLLEMLFSYGASKLYGFQFPVPGEDRLSSTYGESSPMGLMWAFMGASLPYQIFGGAMEALGGLLLVFRRTTLLGALVTVGVMTNVFVLNLCYDVPVKILSFELLIMALCLVAPDAPRLFNAFVLNRPVPAADEQFRFWATRPWSLVRRGLVAAIVMFSLYENFMPQPGINTRPVDSKSVAGVYQVESSTGGLDDVQRIGITSYGARIYFRSGAPLQRVLVEEKTEEGRVVMQPRPGETALTANLVRAAVPETTDQFVFTGTWNGAAVTLTTKKLDLSNTMLLGRGFHWVNEFPFNH